MVKCNDNKNNIIYQTNKPYRLTEHNSRNYTGKASVKYPNNDTYEGDFKDGLRDGVGTYDYFKEEGAHNKYEGEWVQNVKHGIGKMTFADVGEYFGRYENGKMHGEGKNNIK